MAKSPAKKIPANHGPTPIWVAPPDLEEGFTTKIGASIVDEFVAGHDAGDVLRELVQNEFDAGGESMTVTFGKEGLRVAGTGRPVDAKGWARLNVVIGTGRVVGGPSQAQIKAKENGIGSKNFGLRSLFLFGNRIHVRSSGKMAVLDLPRLGTQVIDDPASKGKQGIEIYVPYRRDRFEMLEPFDVALEKHAFDKMGAGVLPTLVKLASAGARRGLRRLILESERTGRRLVWDQSVSVAKCKVAGVSAVFRSGRLWEEQKGQGGKSTSITSFEEMEFTWSVKLPKEFRDTAFPGYYRAAGDKLKIGISIPLKRKRIDLSAKGRFHYPLQAPNSATGTTLSVSAPFKLDADRSALLKTPWNDWLASQAAAKVEELLAGDWRGRFGADAFLALRSDGAGTHGFADALEDTLANKACWPNASTPSKLVEASEIAVPTRPEFAGLLGDHRYLAADLTKNKSLEALLLQCGARPFTANSVVWLRCADKDGKLETRRPEKGNDAHYYYENYAAEMSRPERQLAFAKAMAATRFSNPNHRDLKNSPSTLAADGTLKPAKDLVVVGEDIWDVCPAPPSTRLHRRLLGEKALTGMCRSFDLDVWIRDACARAMDDTIDDAERKVLYERLLAGDTPLGPKALAAVRKAPVVLNQRSEWVAPVDLLPLPPKQAKALDLIVDRPAAKLAKSGEVLRRLTGRRTLTGADLIDLAGRAAQAPSVAESFEEFLRANSTLLTPKTVAALAGIRFLKAADGWLAAPAELHLDNEVNRVCLTSGHLVSTRHPLLYKQLQCRELPSPEVMLQILRSARDDGRSPPAPEIFYPALVQALRTAKRDARQFAEEPIVWLEGAYRAPADILTGGAQVRWLTTAVPVFRGPAVLAAALEALGASAQPKDRHWIALFSWCAARRPADQPVTGVERAMLRQAYAKRGFLGLPNGIAETVRCLLSEDGRLFSLRDVSMGVLVENDYAALADRLKGTKAKLAFADLVDGSRNFFDQLGLKRLTVVCGAAKVSVVGAAAPPAWFRPKHAERVLGLLRRHDFQLALRELAWALRREGFGFKAPALNDVKRGLGGIRSVDFVGKVALTYRLGTVSVVVDADSGATSDRLVMVPTRTKFEYEQNLSFALAQVIGATKIADARRLAMAITPLLRCETRADIQVFLERQGMKPPEWNTLAEDYQATTDDRLAAQAEILRDLVDEIVDRAERSGPGAPPPQAPPPPPAAPATVPPKPSFKLPDINEVVSTEAQPEGRKPPQRGPTSGSSGWGSSGGGWRDFSDIQRDRLVGDRGEELVYRRELERVRAMGHADPENLVVWTAKTSPGADHDIRSIDDDGAVLWLEVKSTTGSDGRFEWSEREFEKALRDGDRYILWRVYEAAGRKPVLKAFRNPAACLARGEIRLEISGLRAQVEGK